MTFGRPLILLLLTALASLAADKPEPVELGTLRRDFEKRHADAVRPVLTWYESELLRLERSFTLKGNLDAAIAVRKERETFRVAEAQGDPASFKEFLGDTRWRWNGPVPQDITFKKDGTLECAEWIRLGFGFKWRVTGPNAVTYTIVKGPRAVGKEIALTFTPDLSSFTGINDDGAPINASPRLK